MSENIIKVKNNCWIITNPELNESIDNQWFDDKYWLNQGRLLGASSGRGSAWMVKSDQNKMMLRHYYRGGIPAKFIKDKYLWTGLNNTRSFCEFRLLAKMIELDLPVPMPIAAQVSKSGFFYQTNILIEYLIHESTFSAVLNTNSLVNYWQKVGETVADFHNHGIYHADLNAHNILISDKSVYLIDFDNSTQCQPKKTWQQGNLKRLKRSIDKITTAQFAKANEEKWKELIKSYNKIIDDS